VRSVASGVEKGEFICLIKEIERPYKIEGELTVLDRQLKEACRLLEKKVGV